MQYLLTLSSLVMSDWTGINSVAQSIEAGCDLEMPHSEKWRGDKAVQAVKDGKLSREAVEKAAANVLYLIERTKGYDMTPEAPEREDDLPERAELIKKAGVEGLTLLKNDGGLLPIKSSDRKIAVIGPNAARPIAGGGGSASLNPYYTTLPLDSIHRVEGKEFVYSLGCEIYKWLPVASPFCTTHDGKPGVILEFHTGDKFEGKPTVVQNRKNTDLFLWDSAPVEVGKSWSARCKTKITPTTTGKHTLSFSSVGPGRLFVDGKEAVDLWNWTEEGEAMFDASEDVLFEVEMEAGKSYELLVETNNGKLSKPSRNWLNFMQPMIRNRAMATKKIRRRRNANLSAEIRPIAKIKKTGQTHGNGGCRIGFKEEDKTDYLQEAVNAAKSSDVAIVIVGLDQEWESEGYDRQTMDLPKDGSQDRLVEAVLAANPRTVVVNQSGSPVTMPWASKVPTILQAWYQGQEAGNALADVLFGKVNPSGKLPTSFPVKLSDNPSYHNWPGENLRVVYGEGLHIGYRHYDKVATKPLFPFGHGLSYTTFEYGNAKTSSTALDSGLDSIIRVTVPIKNTGDVAGAEIVQAYVRDVKSRLPRPVKELGAFTKVFLEPGETKNVTLSLDKYSVGYYDTSIPSWIAEEGEFQVLIGASSVDIR
jgi:beta-glucosidase